jgi:hypothetical protein
MGQRIRIQAGQNCQPKRKKGKKSCLKSSFGSLNVFCSGSREFIDGFDLKKILVIKSLAIAWIRKQWALSDLTD